MGEILTKTCFSPESEQHRTKPWSSVVMKNFGGNSQGTSLFSTKNTISEGTETLRKFVILNIFGKGKS